MLELVPVLVFEREVVGCGNVPAEEDEIHGEPCDDRRDEEVAKAPKSLHAKQWSEQGDGDGAGKAAQQRDDWIAEKKQRRGEGHQQKMLDHVGAEESIGEAVEGRGDGEPDDGEAEEEGSQPPGGENGRRSCEWRTSRAYRR